MDITDAAEADAVAETITDRGVRQPLPDACFACAAPVQGPYCYRCGQKNDDCRRSILRLGGESLTDVFALDGRFWRTFGSVLFRPGRHVRDYGDGKRSFYSPPVRFFLVISLIFFTALALSNTHLMTLTPSFTQEGDAITNISVEPGILQRAQAHPMSDEERQAILVRINIDGASGEVGTIKGRSVTADHLVNRLLAIAEDSSAFNSALNDWIPRLMIILIPLMAVLGALFIRGKNALIYDHLLVAINVHAMMFIILTIALLGSLWIPFMPRAVYAWAFFAGVPVYYFVAIKGAFRRGWIKTTVAAFVTWLIYSLFFLIGVLFVTGRSVYETL